jgi:tRNA pseudouridine38-40 synthase
MDGKGKSSGKCKFETVLNKMAQRYFIRLAYNGCRYHGWQVQDNAPSVQQALQEAIRLLWKEDVNLVGCGRTDTGVHARDFYAHFDLPEARPEADAEELAFRLNRYFPDDLVIYGIVPVPGNLHARFSALSRTYEYHIHTFKDPFLNEFSWYLRDRPDPQRMNEGAALLLQTSDFTSFSKLHSAAKTNICKVTEACWTETGHRMVFTITADRFLRNMVRAVVGTLVDLGQGKITTGELRRIIDGKDRSLAGESVPAKGLFLTKVKYPPPDSLFK